MNPCDGDLSESELGKGLPMGVTFRLKVDDLDGHPMGVTFRLKVGHL